jgi:hypothetical protein
MVATAMPAKRKIIFFIKEICVRLKGSEAY